MYISFNKIRIFVSNNKHFFSSETQKITLSEQGFNSAFHRLQEIRRIFNVTLLIAYILEIVF